MAALACGDDATNVSGGGSTGEEETTSGPTMMSTTGVPTPSGPSGTVTTGMSTTTATSTTEGEESSTTVVGPACGDGNEDPGEECDDGNLDQDDACTAECTIAYEEAWTVSYNGPASNQDRAVDVIADGAGNLLVVGEHRTVNDSADVWLQQYAPDGTELWNFTWDRGVMLADRAQAVALHPSGDVILVGSSETVEDDDDIMVMRVPFDGTAPTWVDIYDGPGAGKEDFDNGDFANGVVVDSAGEIIVAGNERIDGERANVWVRKYDVDGGEVWLSTYSGAANEGDTCDDIAIDGDDNVLVLCTVRETDDTPEAWIRQYDVNGAEVATNTLPFLSSAMHRDDAGNLYFAGFADAGTLDFVVAKYDAAFAEQWTRTINGPSASSDFALGVTSDGDGNVYAIGSVGVTGQQDNIYVHAFDPDGEDRWAMIYNNETANLGEVGFGILAPADGAVYAVGEETVFGEQRNAWTRKLNQF